MLRPALAVLVSALWSATAIADPQSKSWSSWTVSGGDVRVVYTMAAREATRMPAYRYDADLERVMANAVTAQLSVTAAGAVTCDSRPAMAQSAREGYLRIERQWQCPANAQAMAIHNQLLFDVAPSHIHFARFRVGTEPGFEKLFTRHQQQQVIALENGEVEANLERETWQTIATYTLFGFEHILIGLDHIAFLLALMLFAQRLRDVLLIVTGFTIGHSVTLSLTVLRLATPDLMVVEALIGFTIAMVAVENVVAGGPARNRAALALAVGAGSLALLSALAGIGPPALSLLGLGLFTFCYFGLSDSEARARTLRPAVTTLFGLIHGFGFASVLLEVGLPEDAVVPALFGFNVGVEIGQVAIVCAMALVGTGLARLVAWQRTRPLAWLNAGLCGLGMYWFVQRLYF